MDHNVCCDRWKEETSNIEGNYRWMAYPKEMHPTGQIEFAQLSEGAEWCVNGCCGGGCFVLTGLKFCPWCGTKLPEGE